MSTAQTATETTPMHEKSASRLQRQVIAARVAERTRIAQELHDTLLQGLFGVSMQLQAAVHDLPADSAVKPRFCALGQLLDRVLEEGRLAVQGLRSPDEHRAPIGKAFACVPDDLGFSPEVRFRVVEEGRQRELRASVWDEVYRIGREAIVNVYRHSRAKDIEIEIEYRPAELRLAVRDNGCGIDAQRLRGGRDGPWGLLGMRERANLIGGQLRILSRVSLGTEVELRVPGRIAFIA